jgi:excisionase family DNA binding protein
LFDFAPERSYAPPMQHVPAGEHTVDPPADPATGARLQALAGALGSPGSWSVVGLDGERLDLPAELRELLGLAAATLAQGRPVTLSCHEQVLSTQEAADLLGVSRPTLVRLLDQGVIAYDQPRRHRRVLLADLLAYQERCHHAERGPAVASGDGGTGRV